MMLSANWLSTLPKILSSLLQKLCVFQVLDCPFLSVLCMLSVLYVGIGLYIKWFLSILLIEYYIPTPGYQESFIITRQLTNQMRDV